MKKLLAVVLCALMLSVAFTGCGRYASAGDVALKYHDYKESTDAYNRETVYRNDLATIGADPSVIYVSEGEQAGYYYMYITSDDIGASGYLSYRSKNLNDWECMGIAYQPTLYTDENGVTYSTFATTNFWAPEVIYDNGLYYMFYNAAYLFKGLGFYLDCAISENPNGPFVQYAEYVQTTNASQEVKDAWKPVRDDEAANKAGIAAGKLFINKPLFDFAKMDPADELYEDVENGYMKVIDASPFVDPKTGDKFIYFVHDLGESIGSYNYPVSTIYVIAVNDDWTPVLDENGHYKTVKKLTETNRTTVGGALAELNEGAVNEGPFVVYNEESDKYYLTFSVNNYKQKTYQVRVAVADNPMGPFTKLTRQEGGNLLYAEGDWHWASGTGHHSFVTANGKTFIVYHAHTNRVNGGDCPRAIAFDEVYWVKNGNGLLVPYVNGPSYSYMPLTTGEYSNIATEAEVTSTNVGEGTDVKYLNDGLIKFHTGFVNEFIMKEGAAVITLKFDTYREIRGLFIFNSKDYDTAFNMVEKVEFDFRDDAKKVTGTAYTDRLYFDWDSYMRDGKMVPGGNFAIEFAPLMVNEIRITLPNITSAHAISEIMVLGK